MTGYLFFKLVVGYSSPLKKLGTIVERTKPVANNTEHVEKGDWDRQTRIIRWQKNFVPRPFHSWAPPRPRELTLVACFWTDGQNGAPAKALPTSSVPEFHERSYVRSGASQAPRVLSKNHLR